jgi:hypothetical protein
MMPVGSNSTVTAAVSGNSVADAKREPGTSTYAGLSQSANAGADMQKRASKAALYFMEILPITPASLSICHEIRAILCISRQR